MTDQRRVLKADETTGRMYADPDLRGDTLAVGLAILRLFRQGERKLLLVQVATMLGWTFPDGSPNWQRVKYVLADDRPRYVPPHSQGVDYCGSPMVRREGRCDQRAAHGVYLRDPDTGEMSYLSSCNRHRSWAISEQRKAQRAWSANGAPQPEPNTGGVLARYLTVDWDTIYRWGDSAWVPLPFTRAPLPRRLRLELIVGEGEGGVADAPGLVLA